MKAARLAADAAAALRCNSSSSGLAGEGGGGESPGPQGCSCGLADGCGLE